ncbi:MAG: hypothetical protein Q7K34_01495 [archaeon]|nr:hypothetical protein [archaeon]
MAFRAEKNPLHPGIYILMGVFIGSGISLLNSGSLAVWVMGISVIGILLVLGKWYFREDDVPIGGKRRGHQSLEHVSSALRENAWDMPLDFKRK